MRTLMPWTRMIGTKELDRLLNRFLEGKLEEESAAGVDWAPSMDVSETKDAVIVKAEVPGIDPKDIHISLQEQLLTIKGEKQEEREEKEEHFYRMERTYGGFAGEEYSLQSVRMIAVAQAMAPATLG